MTRYPRTRMQAAALLSVSGPFFRQSCGSKGVPKACAARLDRAPATARGARLAGKRALP